MKSFFICLFILVFSIPTLAQDLSLRNLLKYREMEVAKVDRKLSRKGWKAMSDSKPTAGIMGKAVWAYSPRPTGDGATAWCVLYYNDTSPSRILYNAYAGNAVEKIHKKMRRRKLSPISEGITLSGVENLENYADYPDGEYMYRLMKYDHINSGGVKIFERSDYEKARENGRL
jgi:hypothetical protein